MHLVTVKPAHLQELASILALATLGGFQLRLNYVALAYSNPLLRNVSEALPGPRQTNQRAELTAIIRALDIVPKDRNAVVVTDSQYSINCVTKWCFVWRENGWKNASGKVVENRDLVEVILAKVDERNRSGIQTQFEWVKGHVNEPGNIEADRLAVDGARRAAQESLHL